MDQNTLCSNLNFLMKEKEISASCLARHVNIPLSSIKKIRNGSTPNPTVATLLPIARFFNVTVEEIVDINLIGCKISLQKRNVNISSPAQIPIIRWEEVISWPDVPVVKRDTIFSEISFSPFAFALYVDREDFGVFASGSLLLIEPQLIPSHRDYILMYDGGMQIPHLRRILIDGEKIFIQSLLIENNVTAYEDNIKNLGVVVEHRHMIKRKPIVKIEFHDGKYINSSEKKKNMENITELY